MLKLRKFCALAKIAELINPLAARPAIATTSSGGRRTCIRCLVDLSKVRIRLRMREGESVVHGQAYRPLLALSIPYQGQVTLMHSASNLQAQDHDRHPTPSDSKVELADADKDPNARVQFSSSTDPVAAAPLLARLCASDGRWMLSEHRRGVERSFQFRTFKKTWEFMEAVAAECRKEKHHPEWANVYNRVHIRWTTHSPPGLSMKDLAMAAFCDDQAREFGEEVSEMVNMEDLSSTSTVTATSSEKGRNVLAELADHIAKEGCDSCAPEKKSS